MQFRPDFNLESCNSRATFRKSFVIFTLLVEAQSVLEKLEINMSAGGQNPLRTTLVALRTACKQHFLLSVLSFFRLSRAVPCRYVPTFSGHVVTVRGAVICLERAGHGRTEAPENQQRPTKAQTDFGPNRLGAWYPEGRGRVEARRVEARKGAGEEFGPLRRATAFSGFHPRVFWCQAVNLVAPTVGPHTLRNHTK